MSRSHDSNPLESLLSTRRRVRRWQQTSREALQLLATEDGRMAISAEWETLIRAVIADAALHPVQTAKYGVLIPTGMMSVEAGFHLPDLDISLIGIQHHRYFLFHGPFAAYLLYRFFRFLEDKYDTDTLVDRVIRLVGGSVASGVSLGIGIHCLTDLFQPKSIQFPVIGSLVNGTLIDDNLWLFGSALYSMHVSREIVACVFARDLASARQYFQDRWNRLTPDGEE